MPATGLLSKNIKLAYKLVSTFTNLPDVMEIPDLGGSIEKIETTVLSDSNKKYINGLKDYGDISFKFLYENTPTSSFRILNGLEAAGLVQEWQVEFPDGTKFTFFGFPSVSVDSVGVNAPLTYTLNIAVSSAITITNPA